MSDEGLLILNSNGQINLKVSSALRHARSEKQIKGYGPAVLVTAIALYEVALDRDRAFDEADTEKYNAWFEEQLKKTGIRLSLQDDQIVVSQRNVAPESIEIFNVLPELKKQLFVSIENSFDYNINKQPDGEELITRRRSFSEEEKSQQMDQYIIALANQQNIDYDPDSQTFSEY